MADRKSYLPRQNTLEMLSLLRVRDKNGLPEGVDWHLFTLTAEQEGVAGIWFDILRQLPDSKHIPQDVINRLEVSYRKTQVKNVLLREASREVLKQLEKARIPVIVLKGAALSELVYADIGLRPMCDIDLLVSVDQSERAIQYLLEAGYFRKSDLELRVGFDRLFRVEVELQTPPPNIQQVEIHWKLLAPLFAGRYVDLREVWERAVPIQIVNQQAYVLGSEDWVLHLAAHAFYKHRRITLQVLYDIDRLIRYQATNLDWDKLLVIGSRFHWMPALAAVLPLCTEVLRTPVPERVLQSARDYRLPRNEQWILNWWMHPGRSERSHIYPDWLTLPNGQARFDVLWAYLFPQQAYVEAVFSPRSKWKIPFMYIQRWWDELKA